MNFLRKKCPHCDEDTVARLQFDGAGNPECFCENCGAESDARLWFKTVTVVSEEQPEKIIETAEPVGLFVYDYGIEIIGVDTRFGTAVVEKFPDHEECRIWLKGRKKA